MKDGPRQPYITNDWKRCYKSYNGKFHGNVKSNLFSMNLSNKTTIESDKKKGIPLLDENTEINKHVNTKQQIINHQIV